MKNILTLEIGTKSRNYILKPRAALVIYISNLKICTINIILQKFQVATNNIFNLRQNNNLNHYSWLLNMLFHKHLNI